MKIGRIILTDQPDKYGPEIERAVVRLFEEKSEVIHLSVLPEQAAIRDALLRLCDEHKCALVFTTGGTGVGLRDFVPDATYGSIEKELPGFGEIMRYYSYERVKLAALSRATAGVRGQTLIINLPGRPKAVTFCLKLLREAIAEALEQITGTRPVLFVDPIEIPVNKVFDFFRRKKPSPVVD